MVHMFTSAHLELVCPACRKKHHGNWAPEFSKHTHYKTLTCDCGYKISIRTKQFNSGHY